MAVAADDPVEPGMLFYFYNAARLKLTAHAFAFADIDFVGFVSIYHRDLRAAVFVFLAVISGYSHFSSHVGAKPFDKSLQSRISEEAERDQ